MSLDHLDDPEPFRPSSDLRRQVNRRSASLRRRRMTAVGATSVATAACVVVGAGAAYGWRQSARIQRVDTAQALTPDAGPSEPFTMLAVGTDSSDGSLGPLALGRSASSNTDTMILVRVDPVANRLSMVSIPRDLWVTSGGTTNGRINAVEAIGGPQLLIDTVESTFGVEVNHYVEIDMDGLRDLADSVGGLEMSADAPARDTHSGLEMLAGCQTLDGDQVLSLVRSRYLEMQMADGRWVSDSRSDVARMERQRAVLLAALRGLQGESLNPLRIDELVGAVADSTTVDAGFSNADLVALASFLHDVPMESIATATVPVEGANIDGHAVLVPLPGFEQYVQDVLGGMAAALLPGDQAVAGLPSSDRPSFRVTACS